MFRNLATRCGRLRARMGHMRLRQRTSLARANSVPGSTQIATPGSSFAMKPRGRVVETRTDQLVSNFGGTVSDIMKTVIAHERLLLRLAESRPWPDLSPKGLPRRTEKTR